MKEIKSLVIVVGITALLYIGVEPFAHSMMHPHVAPADFSFKDINVVTFKGDSSKGKESVSSNCIVCHSLNIEGIKAPMSEVEAAISYGVVPPDLSSAGAIYDANYLASFIKNPTKTAQIEHKFNENNPYSMPSFEWISEEEMADIVSYFKEIAPQNISNKGVFEDACGRCHGMKYDAFKALTPDENLKNYMGVKAPDLSMMIRTKNIDYLHTFMNEPQKLLFGTSMPRVGLTQKAQKQVVDYLESVGDRKKEERENLGLKIILFTLAMACVAYLWKVKIWREVE